MRSVAYRVAAALGASMLLGAPASAATFIFPGDIGAGAIPDAPNPSSLVIPFAASGLSKPVYTVSVDLQLNHTYAGDVSVVLASPDGRARMVVFSRLGGTRSATFGSPANLAGTYRFSDDAGDIWSAAAVGGDVVVAPGNYSALSAGAPQRSDNGGCPTSLTGVFGGLTPAEANGTWTLTVSDKASGDTGTVLSASLRIDDDIPTLFADGFESAPLFRMAGKGGLPPVSHCTNKIQADFNGDGLSDYVLARSVPPDILWLVRYNTGNGTFVPEAETVTFNLGTSTNDWIDTADLDGDRIADAVVWNGDTATFKVRRSSRTIDAVVSVVHGQSDDDPTQSGDYDGDGRDDLALFRAPTIGGPDGPLQVLWRSSASGQVTPIFVGLGVDGDAFLTGGFDYSGDGRADVSVQVTDPLAPADARFTYFDGRNGAVLQTFAFGKSSDFIVPGNYLGNAQFDTLVRRTSGIQREHRMRDAATGATPPMEIFGIPGDSSIGGDYDGDGLSDLAVWRGSPTADASKFIVRSSASPATIWELPFGQAPNVATSDFAVAGSRVH